MARKRQPTKRSKPQINVRMEQELYDLLLADATAGERKPPAQVRLILKDYYHDKLEQRSEQ